MTDRLEKIFLEIPKVNIFADIGCDHGYIAKAMLDGGKCNIAIISDISEKCLNKARTLLKDYIEKNKAISVVSNGFENIEYCDLALIAGMGGEEISLILNNALVLPNKLILQPMKNCEKVRITAISLGYKIVKDFVFKSGKMFYNLISLEKGQDKLTKEEIEFGRDNIKGNNLYFKQMIEEKIKLCESIIENPDCNENTKLSINKELEKLKKYV